ncbi:MAG: single-stranded DNA-binding protein [Cyanobacteria bacterium P01_D01_bin.128]
MNQCILMAEIIQSPQLRYTSDNQTALSEFTVQFPSMRESDPPSQIKVTGWGNLAQEIQEKYKVGDRVLLVGRLSMNSIDRPEGFKEKLAEMTVQRIQALDSTSVEQAFTVSPDAAAQSSSRPAVASSGAPQPPATPTPSPAVVTKTEEPDYDDIPF